MAGSLIRLGREVASSLDAARTSSRQLEAVRERLANGEDVPAAPRARPKRWVVAAVSGVAAAAAVALALTSKDRADDKALTFAVAGAPEARIGQFLSAPAAGEMPMRFSDGTVVRLAPLARARIAETSAAGARVLLEQGALHADVAHRPITRWSVEAGPFVVRVTGTRFDVGWDPETQSVKVALQQGSVVVTGCGIGPEGRRVAAGEQLSASCSKEGPAVVVPLATAAPIPLPSSIPPPPDLESLRAAMAASASASPSHAAPPSTPNPVVSAVVKSGESIPIESALALARSGAFDEAINIAQAKGLVASCDGLAEADVQLLADAARYAKRYDEATVLLGQLRTRFPRTPRATSAAFDLGRVEMDVRHDAARAADWFDICVSEDPQGPLAREALGRAMESRIGAKDLNRARTLATTYLQRYPAGAHAALARRLLSEGDQ